MRRACLALTPVFDPAILDALEPVGLILAPDRKSPQSACAHCREITRRRLKAYPTFEEHDVYIARLGRPAEFVAAEHGRLCPNACRRLSVEVAGAAERIRGGLHRTAHYMCPWARVCERPRAPRIC
jgi:hypothetical protein